MQHEVLLCWSGTVCSKVQFADSDPVLAVHHPDREGGRIIIARLRAPVLRRTRDDGDIDFDITPAKNPARA